MVLIGLAEAVSDTPFSKLERWWDGLTGLRRLCYGVSVAIGFSVVLFGSLLLYGWVTFE